MSTIMYLVRHGATFQNEQRPVILQGHGIDGPLSERGSQQAAEVGRALASAPLAAIYSSPLQRARQTAQAIGRHHQLPIQIVERIHEVDVGQWEGKSWSEIMESDPDHYDRFMSSVSVPYVGGESYVDVWQRVSDEFETLLERHQGESFAVVAHNVVNRVYLSRLLTDSLDGSRKIRQSNCCINIVRQADPQSETEIVSLNSVLHLSHW